MTKEDRKLESVRFAQESTKQIITLCTAIVTFIFGAVSVGALSIHGSVFWFLLAILVFLLLSICTGIVTLYALSGILVSDTVFSSEDPLNSAHYSRFGRLQFYTFVGAVALISVFVLLWPKNTERKIEISIPENISCQLQDSKVVCQKQSETTVNGSKMTRQKGARRILKFNHRPS
jgi:hypothetical protein